MYSCFVSTTPSPFTCTHTLPYNTHSYLLDTSSFHTESCLDSQLWWKEAAHFVDLSVSEVVMIAYIRLRSLRLAPSFVCVN